MKAKTALFFTLTLCLPLIGNAEDSKVNLHKMVDKTSEVYTAIVKGPHGRVPAHVLANAKCIAVLPSVLTGALLVGGTHGEGLASCKTGKNSWSQPVAVSLNQASIGLQAGAKSTDLVLFFETEESAIALKSGEFTLGTDISAVAGKYDTAIDTSGAGVVIYSRTEGIFAGMSMNGGKLKENKKNLESYYGKKVTHINILEGKEVIEENKYTQKLTELLPN